LALVGVLAAIIVSVKEHEEEVAEQGSKNTDTEEVVTDATAQAMVQTPIALLGALLTSSPGTAVGGIRLLARNLPLVLLLVMIGALVWPTQPAAEELEDTDQQLKPNGADHQTPSALRH
jgi:hypothetical protein